MQIKCIFSGLSLLLTILFFSRVAHGQGSWERINAPGNHHLTSLSFVDSLTGWAAGDSGTILHTIDGGKTWVMQDSKTALDIVDIFFLDAHRGYASAFNFSSAPYGTILLRTENGGVDWTTSIYPEENIFITCIFYLDSLNGWMGGKPHALVRTADGGSTWSQATVDTSILAFFPVLSLQFYNEKYGYASGGMFDIAGVIWRTSDGGDTWYAIDPSDAPADEVHALYCFDSTHVLGSGGDPDFGYGVGMIRTSDGGLNWDYHELGMQGIAVDLDFRNDREGWATLGPKRSMVYTLDSGNTWTEIQSPGAVAVSSLQFTDSLHGFAVGDSGAILKFSPDVTGIPGPVNPAGSSDYILFQNFPNPFYGATVIRFIIPAQKFQGGSGSGPDQTVIIRIFDLTGREAGQAVKGQYSSGLHEVIFKAEGLSQGVYFFGMEARIPGHDTFFSPLKKMVLTH
jgi:photosystem II stability/assembly factor-like uncharacterized protein